MEIYNHKEIEKKRQELWEKEQLYKTPEHPKNKQYILDMFPYPSGAGLHVGHPEGYTATDILSRFKRMQGYDVLHPMGWDAFGLPAENYAIKEGVPPDQSTAKNINRFREQIKAIGLSYDWSREVNTSDPAYYKWTQWLFLQFYKAGLAYKKEAYVNWCPKDQTVLANEQVIEGKCDRCGTVVEQKLLSQWFLKITDYADRLLASLDKLDWPDPIKQMQKNWIGRSEGAEIEFVLDNNFLILPGWTSTEQENYYPWLTETLQAHGSTVKTFVYPRTEDHSEDEVIKEVLLKNSFDEYTVIVGHSLGSVVALKTIEKLKKPIAKVVLTGGFLKPEFKDKPRPFDKIFKWEFDFEKIRNNVREIVILHDLNDPIVPESAADELHEKLGGKLIKFEAKTPHIKGKEEPEVLAAAQDKIKVFTTRPDTIFGATYVVLAPEHGLVNQVTTKDQKSDVDKYLAKTKEKSEMERTALEKEKTGVFTGSDAINPATKEKVPIWIGDYVLATYGSGAIMAVPAHDERDFAFAKKYDLGIVRVVNDEGDRRLPYLRDGRLMNSGKKYDTVSSATARPGMAKEFGVPKVQYKLRDWLISRQRYWGAPIPMIYCEKCGIQPVSEKDLPVMLPDDVDFRPTGESPLARSKKFNQVKCPKCDGEARRDHDTMDTFVDSSWYYFRFTDPTNDQAFADKNLMKEWLPVDTYVGGAEHAVMHLLYARFFTKALFDLKFVDFEEPFTKLRNQGLILGPDGEKMSKSRGNVINPDDVIEQYGADAFRMYEMFMGPLEDAKPWSTTGIVGLKRFLDRVWRYQQVFEAGDDNNHIHRLIEKITSDIENFKFNTAIAAFMEFLNENKEMSEENWETFLILLAPFAPHITDELWEQLGHKDSIHQQAWPKFDERYVRDEEVTVVVQVLGRVRGSLKLAAGTAQEEAMKLAKEDPNVKKYLDGKEIVKEIFVQDKLINFVVK